MGVSRRRFFVVHGAQPKSVYRRRTELEKSAATQDAGYGSGKNVRKRVFSNRVGLLLGPVGGV